MDIPSERRELQRLRAIEVAKLQTLQDEVEKYERDALATGTFAPGYAETKQLRDAQHRAVTAYDGRLEAVNRRSTNLINSAFRKLALKHYPDADRLLQIAIISIDPDREGAA